MLDAQSVTSSAAVCIPTLQSLEQKQEINVFLGCIMNCSLLRCIITERTIIIINQEKKVFRNSYYYFSFCLRYRASFNYVCERIQFMCVIKLILKNASSKMMTHHFIKKCMAQIRYQGVLGAAHANQIAN